MQDRHRSAAALSGVLVALAAWTAAGPALAHSGTGLPGGFVSGFLHPLSGFDHLLAMVSVGAAIFTAVGVFVAPAHVTDPTRIAAQVVTGVGFLGAGAIFRAEDGVKGLTTAATVWVVAALGMAVGFGLYIVATAGAVIVLLGLVLVRPLEIRFLRPPSHPMRRRDDDIIEAGGDPLN